MEMECFKLKTSIISMFFFAMIVIVAHINNFAVIGNVKWIIGGGIGLLAIYLSVLLLNSKIAFQYSKIISSVGILFLMGVAFGIISGPDQSNRIYFTGFSVGCFIGFCLYSLKLWHDIHKINSLGNSKEEI